MNRRSLLRLERLLRYDLYLFRKLIRRLPEEDRFPRSRRERNYSFLHAMWKTRKIQYRLVRRLLRGEKVDAARFPDVWQWYRWKN